MIDLSPPFRGTEGNLPFRGTGDLPQHLSADHQFLYFTRSLPNSA